MNLPYSTHQHPRHREAMGFTLVELLVSLGIIVLLIGILFPVLRSVRRRGREVVCASNMRQLATALIAYAGQNKGSFPPNSSQLGQFWYLQSIIGPYVTAPGHVGRAGAIPAGAEKTVGLAGGVFVCPDDLPDSVRSYSMNIYASGAVSSGVRKRLDGKDPPGKLFRLGAGAPSSRLILLVESWPELPVKGTRDYVAQAIVGFVGKPGERFGGGRGVVWTDPPDATKGRFDVRASQIAFYRHGDHPRDVVDPNGRANFAFADGHVAMLRQKELVDRQGHSTNLALWSPIDRQIESTQK